jgi:ferredoxin-NADP reductase
MASSFTFPFVSKESVAKDTYSFIFDRSSAPEYDFIPGQYNRMVLPHDGADDRGTSRFFTISSSPHIKETLMVTTKVIQSTFKKKLESLPQGEAVQFFGPMGSFVLDENEKNPRIYLAGGIGLTPFHSMLTYSAAKNVSIPQTLFVSFSTPEEVVFYDELKGLNQQNKALRAVFTVTHPEESTRHWDGETGRIGEELIKKHVSLTGEELYYLCGPTPMVDAMREMIQKMGVSDEQIRVENFSGY